MKSEMVSTRLEDIKLKGLKPIAKQMEVHFYIEKKTHKKSYLVDIIDPIIKSSTKKPILWLVRSYWGEMKYLWILEIYLMNSKNFLEKNL